MSSIASAPAAASFFAASGTRSITALNPSGVMRSTPRPVTTNFSLSPYIATPSSGMPRSAGGKINPRTGTFPAASLRLAPSWVAAAAAAHPAMKALRFVGMAFPLCGRSSTHDHNGAAAHWVPGPPARR